VAESTWKKNMLRYYVSIEIKRTVTAKEQRAGVVVHACNPSTGKTETGAS
jgi:hypothetical protein